MGLKFLQDIVNLDNIQFVNSSGTNAGLINMDGNDLVISNSQGDVLLGDGSADVFIGDGTNNVDIRFEQSGSITADNASATLTIGGTGNLVVEEPTINNPTFSGAFNLGSKLTLSTSNGYILFDYEPAGDTGEYTTEVPLLKVDHNGVEKTILSRISENGGIQLGHDDSVLITAGDVGDEVKANWGATGENVVLASETGFYALAFPNNSTTWSNRNIFRFHGGDATAANNGLYIGDGSSTQFIDLDRNISATSVTAGNIKAMGGGNLFVYDDDDDTKIHFFASSNSNEGFLQLSNGSNWGLLARGKGNDPRLGAYHGGYLSIWGFGSNTGADHVDDDELARFDFANERFDVNGEIRGDSLDIDGNADISGALTVSGTIDGVDIGANYANWNTAYGWGNHASAGYLTSSSTQSKYLRSDADDTATGYLTLSGGITGSNSLMTSFFLPQNPEGSHVKSPWFFNDMAYARLRGATITVTVNGGSAPSNAQIDAMFDASTGFWSMPTSGVTSVVVEMTNPPKSMQHGAHYGVTFGNTTWRANSVDIEAYYSGAYQEVVSTTSNSKEFVYGAKNSAGNTVSKIKWTFSNFNTTSMRIVSLFAYNYNATGMPSLYLAKDGGEMYGDIDMGTNTITDTKVGQWDTAYGWGDHSSAGYLTGVSGNISVGNINMTGELNFTGAGSKYIDVETLAGSNNLDIRHHNPTGNLFETAFRSTANGGTFLYYNGNTKFATTNTGISITGDISVSGTVDGVDIATRDAILTSTTTTANAALPKAGGTMTGAIDFGNVTGRAITITGDSNVDSADVSIYLGNSPSSYGWDLKYMGTGTGNTNTFDIVSTNLGSPVTALSITQDGNISVSGTVDGRDIATDGTKLDTIATNADVTPSWVPSSDPSYLTAHPNISAASSVNNSGKTYIQDITLDSNGHVTGLVSDSLTGSDFIEPGSNGALNSLTCDTFNSEDSIAFNLDTDTNSTSTFVIKSDGSTLFSLNESGDLTITGKFVSTYAAKGSSGDILVDDSGEIKKRTPAELKTDLSLNNVPNTDATNASNLASGTVPTARLATTTIAKGGTGATTASGARTALGLGSAATSSTGDFAAANHNHDSDYAALSHNHSATSIVTGTLDDARISESSVTQHEAALSITEGQLPDDMPSDKVKQICTTSHNFYKNGSNQNNTYYFPFNSFNEGTNTGFYYLRTVAPYNGRIVKIVARADADLGSDTRFRVHVISNTNANFSTTPTEQVTVDMSTANTGAIGNFTSSSHFSAGDAVGVGIRFVNSTNTGNIYATVVWEYTL